MSINGILGYGYWGKIIHKTLGDAKIYDIVLNNTNKADLYKCKNIFVSTPVLQHYKECKEFIEQGKNIFCEKTLTGNIRKSNLLFNLAQAYNTYLFVDWIFLYNDYVKYIKKIIDNKSLGKLKNISMNRLNLGPVRTDIDARIDLASHDLSILYYLLNPKNVECKWINYQRVDDIQNNSCFGILNINDISIQIHCSWHHINKDRICIFEFENGTLIWDDTIPKLSINNFDININYNLPLKNAINSFLNQTTNQENIQSTTLFVEQTLCM